MINLIKVVEILVEQLLTFRSKIWDKQKKKQSIFNQWRKQGQGKQKKVKAYYIGQQNFVLLPETWHTQYLLAYNCMLCMQFNEWVTRSQFFLSWNTPIVVGNHVSIKACTGLIWPKKLNGQMDWWTDRQTDICKSSSTEVENWRWE